MYRFEFGKYAHKTVEEVMLRDAPYLYQLALFAQDKPRLSNFLTEFNRLRKKLHLAPIHFSCMEKHCRRRVSWMTLPASPKYGILPRPYWWCDKHDPWETTGITPKIPIHFDIIRRFNDKGGQRLVFRKVKNALGFKTGARITEKGARKFFANLS